MGTIIRIFDYVENKYPGINPMDFPHLMNLNQLNELT